MIHLKSDKEIMIMMGSRLLAARLRCNLGQEQVATFAGISKNAVQKAEKGESLLSTYIKILRVLDLLDDLDNFLPEPSISPIEVIKMQGKRRQRASRSRTGEKE